MKRLAAFARLRVAVLLLVVVGGVGMVPGSAVALAPTAPSLGTAGGFAVLAGTRVTCTNSSLDGNVGVWPGTPPDLVATSCPVSGAIDAGDSVAHQAYTAFQAAYASVAQQPCDQVVTTLDGQTLAPGVYCFDAAATSANSTVTLDGPSDGIWIFKVGTLGTGALTGTDFNVVMADGTAPPCNAVYWHVAQSVTMTDSTFVGTVLAGAAVTLTGGSFAGRVLAADAATITGTSFTACPEPGNVDSTPPVLTLPAPITVNATSPSGALVHYVASATDNVTLNPALSCVPASGSTFKIGTTTVACTATDDAGNRSAGTFTVTVNGASQQIADLITQTRADLGLPVLPPAVQAQLQAAINATLANRPAAACTPLRLYIALVRLLTPSKLTATQSAALIAEATQISNVLGC